MSEFCYRDATGHVQDRALWEDILGADALPPLSASRRASDDWYRRYRQWQRTCGKHAKRASDTDVVDIARKPAKSVNQVTDKALADDLPPASQVAATQEPGLARALLATWRAHAAGIDMRALRAACGPDGSLGAIMDALGLDALGEKQTAVLVPRLTKCVKLGLEVGAEPLRKVGVIVRSADHES